MPAINPERLQKQIEDLLVLLGDPAAFKRQCLDLLDFYSDRTRRPTASTGVEYAQRVFGVPRPVLRAMSNELCSCTHDRSDLAWPVAAALWEAGYRETRFLASAILGVQQQPEAPQWAETWALTCGDSTALAELAYKGLASWRKADPTAFLEQTEIWLSSPRKRLRLFAILALRSAVEDSTFEDLPTVFRLMSGVSQSMRGESRRSFNALVRLLAKRSPPEATRFLLDELKREVPGTERLIRISLGDFPHHQRKLLERALSAEKQAGIIF